MLRSSLVLIFLLQTASTTQIRVDSRNQGRTFIVDTARPEIRKELRDVAAPAPAGPLPAWLPPYPGATTLRTQGNGPPDFGLALYSSTALPDVVFAHYEAAIRGANTTITYNYRQAGRGGAIHAESATHYAVVSVSPGVGPTDISVNWHARTVTTPTFAPGTRFEAVWFDDSKGVLRLRDTTTRKEYDLDMAAMLRYARSQALESSARADFPAWLVFYPGAKVVVAAGPPADWRPQKPSDMRSYNIEMEATASASTAEIAAFYRDVMTRNGLTIENETQSRDVSYSLQARTKDGAHHVSLNVLKRPRDTFIRLGDSYTLPRP
jgi:hypothetical protein